MCTGLELAALSALATAGGGYMQYQANEDRAEASEDAAMAEAMRQDRLDQKKFASFQDALGMVDRGQQQGAIDKAAQEREAIIAGNSTLPGQDEAYQPTASAGQPKVVQEYADTRADEAQDFADMLGGARARMGAWGEGMMDFQEGVDDLSWWMDEYNRRAGRSAQIGLEEARAAYQNTGNEKALYGNLFTGAGQLGAGFAGSKLATSAARTPVTKFDMKSAFDAAPVRGNFYSPAAVAGHV